MNSNQLIQFIALAQEQNVTRAANKLFMTQSSLSNVLKRLEEELGCELFDRVGNRIILNKNGEILLKYAQQVKDLMDDAVREIEENRQKDLTSVHIVSDWHRYFQFIALRELIRVIPVQLDVGQRDELLSMLVGGTCDIVITANYPPLAESIPREVCKQFLFDNHLFISVPPEHRLARRKEASIRDFQNEAFLMAANEPNEPWIQGMLRKHKVDVSISAIEDWGLMNLYKRNTPKLFFATSLALNSPGPMPNTGEPSRRHLIRITDEDASNPVYAYYLEQAGVRTRKFLEVITGSLLA